MLTSQHFGRTGRTTTRIGFGAWAIGGTWGEVSHDDAKATLHAALDAGMTFIDTAGAWPGPPDDFTRSTRFNTGVTDIR